MLWRVAIRLHRDHAEVVADRGQLPTCALCGDQWPCFGRRLAIRGLLGACRPALARDDVAGPADQYLGADFDRPGR
jgi:hypothetical protein